MVGKTYSFIDQKTRLKRKLPIPLLMLIGSVLLWLSIFYSCFLSYKYIPLYLRIYQDADLKVPCPDQISISSSSRKAEERNVNRVLNYPLGEAAPYLKTFGSKDKDLKTVTPAELRTLPYLMTVVDESQFYQVQSLIRHLQEDLSSVKGLYLIIYDIGLNSRQRDLVLNNCDCILRNFRAEIYPEHVSDYSNFAWRPLIIQEVLEEAGSVIYIEPTTRFKDPSALEMFRRRGIRPFYLWDTEEFKSLVAYTDPRMFHYFNEKRCDFFDLGIISTEIMVFYKTNTTWLSVIKPWMTCALNEDCVAPSGARNEYCFSVRHPLTTGCHWYDQSALSIITNRAYKITIMRKKYIPQRLTYYSSREETYFPEQPWTNFQVMCIIFSPIVAYIIYRARRKC